MDLAHLIVRPFHNFSVGVQELLHVLQMTDLDLLEIFACNRHFLLEVLLNRCIFVDEVLVVLLCLFQFNFGLLDFSGGRVFPLQFLQFYAPLGVCVLWFLNIQCYVLHGLHGLLGTWFIFFYLKNWFRVNKLLACLGFGGQLTVLCFLCSSSAYLLTSLTKSDTFCTICMCRDERRSADVLRTCHTGANVPCTQQLLACLANLLNSLELFSSMLDL